MRSLLIILSIFSSFAASLFGGEAHMWNAMQSRDGTSVLAIGLSCFDLTGVKQRGLAETVSDTLAKYQSAALNGKLEDALALSTDDPVTIKRVTADVRQFSEANVKKGMLGRFSHVSAIGYDGMYALYSEFEDGSGGTFPHFEILIRSDDGKYRISKTNGLENILVAMGNTYPSEDGPAKPDQFVGSSALLKLEGIRFASIKLAQDGKALLEGVKIKDHEKAHLAVVFNSIMPVTITKWIIDSKAKEESELNQIRMVISKAIENNKENKLTWRDPSVAKICGYIPSVSPWVLIEENDSYSFISMTAISGKGELTDSESDLRSLLNNRVFISFLLSEKTK